MNRKWKAIYRNNVDWPTGVEGKVFWVDENRKSVVAVYYISSKVVGVVDRLPTWCELSEAITLSGLPYHPEMK